MQWKPRNQVLRAAMLSVLLCGSTSWAQAELAVVVHPGNPATALDLEEVKRIFMGKSNNFPGGQKVTPVDQRDGSPVKESFITKVLQKDAAQLTSYWATLIFSGKGKPPAAVGNDADVINWVKDHPDGLGYVDAAAVNNSVKVLLRVP